MFVGATTRRVKAASSKSMGAAMIPDRSNEGGEMNNGSSSVGAVDLPWSRHRVGSVWFGALRSRAANWAAMR